MDSLKTLMTIARVGKVVCTILFVLAIIGACCCALLMCLVLLFGGLISAIASTWTGTFMVNFGDSGMAWAFAYALVGILSCCGMAVCLKLERDYFKYLLNAGTPFTYDGAKRLFDIGLANVIITVATSVFAGIVTLIFSFIFDINADDILSIGMGSIWIGVTFIIISIICKCGAEMQDIKKE